MPTISSGRVTSGTGTVTFSNTSVSGTTFQATVINSVVTPLYVNSVTGQNIGVGTGLFAGTTGTQNITLDFKTLIGGTGIAVRYNDDTVTLTATGQYESGVTFVSLEDGPGDFVANAVVVGTSNSLIWSDAATTANTVLTFIDNSFQWLPPSVDCLTNVVSSGNGNTLISPITTTDTVTLKSLVAGPGIILTSNTTTITVNNASFVNAISNVVTLTGDVLANGTTGSNIVTVLSNTGVSAGNYGSANTVVVMSVDSKGRVLSASNVAIQPYVLNSAEIVSALGYYPGTSNATQYVLNSAEITTALGFNPGTSNASSSVVLIGDVSATGNTGSNIVTVLSNTGVSAGSYGSANTVVVMSVDSKGRVLSASNVAIQPYVLNSAEIVSALGYYPGTSNALSSIFLLGDISGSGITGSGISTTLAAVGVAGTYAISTTDSKGRVIAGRWLTANDITTVLGFTPGMSNASSSVMLTGDVLGSGTTGNNITTALALVGVAGTYAISTTDSKGRVIAGRGLTANDITTALGYTPSNASQYVLNAAEITTALGYTPISTVPVQTVFGRTGNIVLTSNDVTTALGFTPTNYILNSAEIVSALGFNPGTSNASASVMLAGDVSGSGTTGSGITTTLATVGVAGTYAISTTDSKGRVIAGRALSASDVTTALGYTPLSNASSNSFYNDPNAQYYQLSTAGATFTIGSYVATALVTVPNPFAANSMIIVVPNSLNYGSGGNSGMNFLKIIFGINSGTTVTVSWRGAGIVPAANTSYTGGQAVNLVWTASNGGSWWWRY